MSSASTYSTVPMRGRSTLRRCQGAYDNDDTHTVDDDDEEGGKR